MPLSSRYASLQVLVRACWCRCRKFLRSRLFEYGYLYVRRLWHAPLQRHGSSLSEAYALLEETCSASVVAARANLSSPEPGPEAPDCADNDQMSRRRAHRNRLDRRQDKITADLVEVGLMFAEVFGRDRGETYFRASAVEPAVYRRVLLGPCRQSITRDDGGDPVSS